MNMKTEFCSILIVTGCLLMQNIKGDCLYEGGTFKRNTLWSPNSCSICTCEDPVVMCEDVRCSSPNCDTDKGEYLQIPAEGCCPECVRRMSPCLHESKTIPHNSVWSPSRCNFCHCFDGEITCTPQTCPLLRCRPGEVPQVLADQCCPQCIPTGRPCEYDHHVFPDATEWSPIPCTMCVCRDGQTICYPIQCSSFACPQGKALERRPGSCCPVCVSSYCTDGSSMFKNGDHWNRDSCTTCTCIQGEVVCTSKTCMEDLECGASEQNITRDSECCSECIRPKDACTSETPIHYHGDIWNVTDCEFCTCRGGNVQCYTAVCEPAICLDNEMLIHEPGKCCKECVERPTCHYGGQMYHTGDSWQPDSCTLCHCRHGDIVCYSATCPVCPVGSMAVKRAEECCGQCQTVTCGSDCQTCKYTDPNYCTACKLENLYLHEGKCIQKCPDGFYGNMKNECHACHDSCNTCVDLTRYHCQTCKPGLLWKDGECVSRCGMGYYQEVTHCYSCDKSCSLCIGPSTHHCLACSQEGLVIQSGQCIEQCYSNFYLQYSECNECPATCATCSSDGQSCTSCYDGLVLHRGQCLSQCLQPYFQSDGVCKECFPACKSCSGPKDTDCMTCVEGSSLSKRGRCKMSCQDGKYMKKDGTCRDCGFGCAKCHISRDGSTSVCLQCEKPSMLAFDDICMRACPVGRYADNGICRVCGSGCLRCSSYDVCTVCGPNQIVSDGICVRHCKPSQYIAGKQCKDCPAHCMECMSNEDCSQCDGRTYLLNRQCIPTCGAGYYQDNKSRRCERNQEAPRVQLTGHMEVEKGNIVSIPESLFNLNDLDTSVDNIVIVMTSPPSGGNNIVKVNKGNDIILEAGDVILPQELREGKIRFLQNSPVTSDIKISFKAFDRQLYSDERVLYVQVINHNAPQLVRNELVLATVGETTQFTDQIIELRSLNPVNTMMSIIEGPLHGQINQHGGQHPVTSFSVQDLHTGSIGYQLNPHVIADTDMCLVQVTDGYHILSFIINFQIRQKENRSPLIVNNEVGHVYSKDMLQISPNLLMTKSLSDSKDIIYTLSPASNNPQHGEILMLVPIPSNGVGKGWQDMGDGQMAAKMFQFLQRDVNEGRIWYHHTGTKTSSDIITFEVKDSHKPPNILKEQSFHINIMEPPLDQARPSVAPGVRLEMSVYEDQVVPIGISDLAFHDPDTPEEEIIYTITKGLKSGEGTLENKNFPLQPFSHFTQADLKHNKIVYHPPKVDVGNKEKEVFFIFTVSDGRDTNDMTEYQFLIHILPVNNLPPFFSSPSAVIKVPEGGVINIDRSNVILSDADTPVTDLVMTLTKTPVRGVFEKVMKNSKVILRKGETFTYKEFLDGGFRYSHDKINTIPYDAIVLSATDGKFDSQMILNITVTQVDKSAPILLSSAVCRLYVKEGKTVSISRDDFGFMDDDASDDNIQIILMESPLYGQLVYKQVNVVLKDNIITQEDINNNFISYMSDKEIGSEPITEVLTFNVSDSNKNILPNQILSIVIEPVDNKAPVVNVGTGIQIEEGKEKLLASDNIRATDLDTTISNLMVEIQTPPKFGMILSYKSGNPGSEKSVGVPTSQFFLQDLLDGFIYYSQSDHQNKEPVIDNFLFHVTDGTNVSPLHRFDVSIVLLNDEEPILVTEQLFVKEHRTVVVTNSSLYVMDLDTRPEYLVLKVEGAPQHGVIGRRDFVSDPLSRIRPIQQGGSFTYQEILDDLIVYQHNGKTTLGDRVTVSVNDGDFTDTSALDIIIGLVDDETPRMAINRGLRLKSGSRLSIKSLELKATDIDSDDSKLKFTLTRDPTGGHLLLHRDGRMITLATRGPVNSFTQFDIDQGHLEFEHPIGEITGVLTFKFDVADPEENKLIDQIFYITVEDDRMPPKVINNNILIIQEGSLIKITTDKLSFTDDDSEPGSLRYSLISAPSLGHLELTSNQGVPISEFTQSDLAANSVCYVHTSQEEIYMDSFTFTVTDGKNEVSQKFHITITPVDDEIPVVTNNGLRVQEGVRKTITEFDLKAVDQDTPENSLIFHVVSSPVHGTLDLKQGDFYMPVTSFSMADVFNGVISYHHDGSETLHDNFAFTVTDGASNKFAMQKDQSRGDISVTTQPETFEIDIMPLDDGMPVLKTNLGLQFLEQSGNLAYNLITARELEATDIDTTPADLTFVITRGPEYGRLENTANPTVAIYSFTQDDIDHEVIRYVLTSKDEVTEDMFTFDLVDSKPNRVMNNKFHIMWSVVEFAGEEYSVMESEGVIRIPIVRSGNHKQYSVVTCSTSQDSATSVTMVTHPGDQDYVAHMGQVQFDVWQGHKVCSVIINDDSTYEGSERFIVELSKPVYSLIGEKRRAIVTIVDKEDKPTVEFKDSVYHTNETSGTISTTIVRTGDLGISVSVVCSTRSLTARGSNLNSLDSGSDYITRGESNLYRITLTPGMREAKCEIKIIDDSEFENSEEFEVVLSVPTYNTAIGPANRATVIIEGPNDESQVSFLLSKYHFDEDSGDIEVQVIRQGSDLSHDTIVWCATRMTEPPSAIPGQDYIPSSSQITFSHGETTQKCRLTILDDTADAKLEGNKTFVVFLSTPIGSILSLPYTASISIYDTNLDVPKMYFVSKEYTVNESSKVINVPVLRSGDLSYESSVICYTRQNTAQVMMDFSERPMTNLSRITFKNGEQVKNCTVTIEDDPDFEPKELFYLRLTEPRGTDRSNANLGDITMTTIYITNAEDVPRIQFKEQGYSIMEPVFADVVSTLVVMVMRMGDLNKTSVVRCSTRDGSAVSGMDYNAKSVLLEFKPGVRSLEFPVEVIHNQDTEWHESFYVVFDENSFRGAEPGDIVSTTVTILDDEVSGSLVLPAPPVVISLLHYDDVEMGMKQPPSPGYPVVCVTPCDVHFPTYSTTRQLCQRSGINQTSMLYRWEVAMPTPDEGSRSPFVPVTDNTVFTSVESQVLDSIYFRPSFHVRCVAQPLHRNSNPGVPTKSEGVVISSNTGICKSPVYGRSNNFYGAQSFLAKLDYVGPDDEKHPNKVHISIRIPHKDGHIPLISTHPLHNLRYVLSDPVYRQQHVCSNLITDKERHSVIDSGFLDSAHMFLPYHNFPYQFDDNLRENKTVNLYRHLDLKSCMWKFDAWYHMTNLVDLCGGKVVSDFQVKEGGKTYLTVRVPLYVYYLYTTAPVGWGSLQHHTEMEFSFYYSNILWQSGLESQGKIAGDLQVLKVLVGRDGRLVVDFKTQTKFRGLYVSQHHTLPDVKSRVIPPASIPLTFDLNLVWSQQTFDSPHQLWRATSDYNLKDYTGKYTIELIPCLVKSTQIFMSVDTPCTAKQPQRFEVPIAFQQSNRPVPLVYSLDTRFELTNNREVFLKNPFTSSAVLDPEYDKSFAPGETLYGRVLWNPAQDLREAYTLSVEKVYLCTGSDGHIPTFDPVGDVYGDGPQFGCLQPSPKLQHRFLILDKGNPDVEVGHFHSIPFHATFTIDLEHIGGVDGFSFSVDPLYKVSSGNQWYLQVIYVISKSGTSRHHFHSKRSVIFPPRQRRDISTSLKPNNSSQNGTDILHIPISNNLLQKNDKFEQSENRTLKFLLPSVFIVIIAFVIIIFIIFKRRRRKKEPVFEESRKNNIELTKENFLLNQKRLSLRLSGSRVNVNVTEVKDSIVTSGEKERRPSVRIKNTNVMSQGKIQGTEV